MSIDQSVEAPKNRFTWPRNAALGLTLGSLLTGGFFYTVRTQPSHPKLSYSQALDYLKEQKNHFLWLAEKEKDPAKRKMFLDSSNFYFECYNVVFDDEFYGTGRIRLTDTGSVVASASEIMPRPLPSTNP